MPEVKEEAIKKDILKALGVKRVVGLFLLDMPDPGLK